MADACCGDDTSAANDDEPAAFWELRDVRLAALAGVGLAAGFVASLLDATTAADVGFALAPTTPEGRPANWLWAWSLAIPASSPDSQLAKEFVTWATSQEYAELVADEHGWAAAPPGTRSDLYDNADYLSAAPFADLVLRSIETADIDEPTTVPVPYQGVQYVDEAAFQSLGTAVGEQVNRAVKGELSLDEALENSQWVADNVIERTRLLAEQRESD